MADGQNYTSDELEAMWQEFQRAGEQPDCPACGATVHIELSGDPAEDSSREAEIYVKCPNCGREGRDTPGAHSTYGWKD